MRAIIEKVCYNHVRIPKIRKKRPMTKKMIEKLLLTLASMAAFSLAFEHALSPMQPIIRSSNSNNAFFFISFPQSVYVPK